MLRFFDEYAKHAALNLGQAMQGIRYVYSHPDIDRVEQRGSLRHVGRSIVLRAKRIAGDLFFAGVPPHWHHTKEELYGMTSIAMTQWFRYGYCAWRFDDAGCEKTDLADVDKNRPRGCR